MGRLVQGFLTVARFERLSYAVPIFTARFWLAKKNRFGKRSEMVAEVAVTYEDRLTRFGQEYLETLFTCFGVALTVLEPGEEKTPEQELTDDLLALIASFSGGSTGCGPTNTRSCCNARKLYSPTLDLRCALARRGAG